MERVLVPLNSVDAPALAKIAQTLADRGIEFALIGGLAVSVRARPRFTRDVDFAVAVTDDAHAEALIVDLRNAGYFVAAVVEQEAVGRLATARLVDANAGIPVELVLLFASSGIENEVVREASREKLSPTLALPVARTGHLLALKLLSVSDARPNDKPDLLMLKAEMTEEEWALAANAVALITTRRYNRGRDLPRALADLRSL